MRRRGWPIWSAPRQWTVSLADADAAGVSAERLLGQLTRTVLERRWAPSSMIIWAT
jgi:hypothetical protein